MGDYDTKKLAELKSLCKERGLSDTGKKAELAERLSSHDATAAAGKRTSTSASASPKLSSAPSPKASASASPRVTLPITAEHVPSLGKVNPTVTTEKLLSRSSLQTTIKEKAPAEMTEEERRRLRAERFGVDNADVEKDKRMARAERFGLQNEDLDREKKKQRAERFGVHNQDLEAEKKKLREQRFGTVSEDDKKKAREERFGTGAGGKSAIDSKLDKPLPGGASSPAKRPAANGQGVDDEEAKRQKRLERFGTAAMTEEQKREARAKRFG